MSLTLPTPESVPTYHDITAAIGRCITCWARVEDELASVFVHTIRNEQSVARAIFYSVRSFEARLDLVFAGVQKMYLSVFNPEVDADWQRVFNLVSRKTRKRNEVTRCSVVHLIQDDGSKKIYADPYCRGSAQRQHLDETTEILDCKQLMERAQGFLNVAIRIALFEEPPRDTSRAAVNIDLTTDLPADSKSY